MSWKEVKVEGFKFENVGDSIEGILVNVSESTQYEGRKVYLLDVKGKNVTIFGTTSMDNKIREGMDMRLLGVGKKIKIVYNGEKKSPATKKTYKDFSVFSDT